MRQHEGNVMSHCLYYQARVVPAKCWFFVGIMRSFEHVCFDRTLDKQTSTFEFFVPEAMQEVFLTLMAYFEKEGIVTMLTELPNRLLDPNTVF